LGLFPRASPFMHLYLAENPRTLYLVTSSQEESKGRPRRTLVFRAAEDNPHQAVVEFLHKDQVNLSNSVRLTSRIVKGCLGLICVGDGASEDRFTRSEA
jgi:synaptojanin